MDFLLTLLGLVLVLEGMPWFLSPGRVKRLLRTILAAPDRSLRAVGLLFMLAGLLLVFLGRNRA
jgi:uncharacterized protein YjeT (DUF2065 family)